MTPPLTWSLFQIGGDSFSWEEVVLFALITGRWDAYERRVREGLVAERHLRSIGAAEPDAAIEAAAAEYRYRRELISAADATAWLAQRGLDSAVWLGWVRREVLRLQYADQLSALLVQYPVTGGELGAAAAIDLHCSDEAMELARALTERLAASAALAEGVTQVGHGTVRDLPDRREVMPLVARFPLLDAGRAAERLPLLRRLEQDYAAFAARGAPAAAVRLELELGRLEWIRVRCQVARFATEDAAREAALCVREDGCSLAAVALDARTSVEDFDSYLGSLDGELRMRLLSAVPPELVGPVLLDQPALFLVLAKTLPEETDPAVWRAAETRVVARSLSDQVSRWIRWTRH